MSKSSGSNEKGAQKSALIVSRQVRNLLGLAAEAQKFNDLAEIFAAKYQISERPIKKRLRSAYLKKRPVSMDMTYAWNELVKSAWHTHHLLKKAEKAKNIILNELPRVNPTINISEKLQIDMSKWTDIRKLLLRYHIKPEIIDLVGTELEKTKGDPSSLVKPAEPELVSILERIGTLHQVFASKIQTLMDAHDYDSRYNVLANVSSHEDPHMSETDYTFRKEEEGTSASGVLTIIGSVIAVIAGLIALIKTLGDWFNDSDDDEAVKIIEQKTCGQIGEMSDEQVVELFKDMIDGPTTDNDECAMLKVLNCFLNQTGGCDRIKNIVGGQFGTENFHNEFDGVEWDKLMILLQHCNLVTFEEWDDDATRLYVNTTPCATINSLSNDNIRQLMLNLFTGGTLDEDEQAIIKIMQCLPVCRITQILNMPDMSVSDFNDEVDGQEWDDLLAILLNAVTHCPDGQQEV